MTENISAVSLSSFANCGPGSYRMSTRIAFSGPGLHLKCEEEEVLLSTQLEDGYSRKPALQIDSATEGL